MSEDSNIGLLCPNHSRKPGKFADVPRETFLGKFVQLGFPTEIEDGPQKENMWVKVTELVTTEDGGEALKGTLENAPVVIQYAALGDEFEFTTDEILQVMGEATA